VADQRAEDQKDAEFQRALGTSPAPQPQPGPQLSDDEEFQRAIGQSGVSTGPGMTDWSKYPEAPPDDSGGGSGVDWSKYPDASPGKPTAQDYAAMPWSQVVEKGVNNLLPSAWNAVKSVPQAIYNYQDTGRAIGQIASGAASKAEGLFSQQDPAQKAQNEAAFNTLVAPYTSVAGFKKALAEDPFSVLTTAAIPFSGGAAVPVEQPKWLARPAWRVRPPTRSQGCLKPQQRYRIRSRQRGLPSARPAEWPARWRPGRSNS